MNRLFLLLPAVLITLSCSGKADPCVEMQEAIDEATGKSCDSGSDCPAIPCACADGSTVDTSSCFNGTCAGAEACEDACGEVKSCPAGGGGGGGGGGGCCRYSCNSGFGVVTGYTTSASDDDTCRTAAEEFCGDSISVGCSKYGSDSCSVECACSDTSFEDGTCPAP